MNNQIKIIKKVVTNKSEIGILIYKNKKYFYKKSGSNTYNEEKYYGLLKKFYKVPKKRIGISNYILYSYMRLFRFFSIHNYLINSINIIYSSEIFKKYDVALNKTHCKKFFYDTANAKFYFERIYEIENIKKNINFRYIYFKQKKIDIIQLLDDLKANLQKLKNEKVHCFLTQGDPTDTNLGVFGDMVDFEVSGYNSIISEIAIALVSFITHGSYYYVKYNPKAYSFHSKKINQKLFVIDYKIHKDMVIINDFHMCIPKKNIKVTLDMLKMYINNYNYNFFKNDMFFLKYLIAMRLITPISVINMEKKDAIIIFILLDYVFKKANNLENIVSNLERI